MQITLSTVVEAARQRKAAVTADAGGYIILLVVQRLASQPRQIDAELIQLTATGEISIEATGPAQVGDTEAALRRLLATLIGLSHAAPPALRAAAERPAVGALSALESELTAALIPINHAASGRALARLFRETEKAMRGSPSLAAGPSSVASTSPASASGSLPAERATPLPVPLSQPVIAPPSELSALEIDVDVVASDDDEMWAGPSSGAAMSAPPSAVAPLSSPLSDAPQLLVEALDELDVLDVDELDPEVPEPLLVAADAALAERAPPLSVVGSHGAAEERAADAHEVADDLDLLLASDLPPPLPSPPALTPALDSLPVSGDVGGEAEAASSPLSTASSVEPSADIEPDLSPQRSDLRDLLSGFLAHTRCEEQMTANLRRMVGLEPWRSPAGVDGPKLGP
ncbi:MAG: hypothetical protein RL685_1179 [Pseudomonadota bacterium]|jgi:hypothetical protein